MSEIVYKIRDKNTGSFWSTKSRSIWTSKAALKGAFNKVYGNYKIKFDEQDKYEIVEYVLVEKDNYEQLITYASMAE